MSDHKTAKCHSKFLSKMPSIYNSGTISDITEINVPKTTIVKSIMSHSL